MTHLLDTCVVSELVASRRNEQVVAWIDAQGPSDLLLSAITIGEIGKGIALLADSTRKTALAQWLDGSLLVRFAGRIVSLDTAVMRRWGVMTAALERRGTPMGLMDSLLAASALHHGLRLVTRNVDDFRRCGVETVNPWDG